MRDTDLIRIMETEMQRMADEAMRGFFSDVPSPNRFWQPRVDLHETQECLVIKVEVAGVDPQKLDVSLSSDDRVLTISGERMEEEDERVNRLRCYQLEVYFGQFEREVVLPADVRVERDAITASYKEGFLTILLPKRNETRMPTHTIPVSG